MAGIEYQLRNYVYQTNRYMPPLDHAPDFKEIEDSKEDEEKCRKLLSGGERDSIIATMHERYYRRVTQYKALFARGEGELMQASYEVSPLTFYRLMCTTENVYKFYSRKQEFLKMIWVNTKEKMLALWMNELQKIAMGKSKMDVAYVVDQIYSGSYEKVSLEIPILDVLDILNTQKPSIIEVKEEEKPTVIEVAENIEPPKIIDPVLEHHVKGIVASIPHDRGVMVMIDGCGGSRDGERPVCVCIDATFDNAVEADDVVVYSEMYNTLYDDYLPYDLSYGQRRVMSSFPFVLKYYDVPPESITSHINPLLLSRFNIISCVGVDMDKTYNTLKSYFPFEDQKQVYNHPVEDSQPILFVIEKFIPDGLVLKKEDMVYNMFFKREMTSKYLHNLLTPCDYLTINYLLKIGFSPHLTTGRIIKNGQLNKEYVVNVLLVDLPYIIPNVMVSEYTDSGGRGLHMGNCILTPIDSIFTKVEFLCEGRVTFTSTMRGYVKTYRLNVIKKLISKSDNITKNNFIRGFESIPLSQQLPIELPILFSGEWMRRELSLFDTVMYESYLMFARVDMLYNSDYDYYYYYKGTGHSSDDDNILLGEIANDMGLSYSKVIHMMFGIDGVINSKYAYSIDNFLAKYGHYVYEHDNHYFMKKRYVQQVIPGAYKYTRMMNVRGMHNVDDLPLMVKRGNDWFPTWIYMSLR